LSQTPGGEQDAETALRRYGAQAALLDDAHATVSALGEQLRAAGYPSLATVISAESSGQDGQHPLLLTAFAWFFQRQVETDPELARGLQMQRLRDLSAARAGHFAALAQGFCDR
jgi:hypothetical protein